MEKKKQKLNTGKTCQRRNLSLLKNMLKEQGRIGDYVVWLQDPQTIVLNLNGHILCKSSVFVCVLCLWNPHKWQKSFLYFFCFAPICTIIRNCAPGTSVERTCTLWHHKGHCYTQLSDSLSHCASASSASRELIQQFLQTYRGFFSFSCCLFGLLLLAVGVQRSIAVRSWKLR